MPKFIISDAKFIISDGKFIVCTIKTHHFKLKKISPIGPPCSAIDAQTIQATAIDHHIRKPTEKIMSQAPWVRVPAIRERSINRRHVYTERERDLSIAGMYIHSRRHIPRTVVVLLVGGGVRVLAAPRAIMLHYKHHHFKCKNPHDFKYKMHHFIPNTGVLVPGMA